MPLTLSIILLSISTTLWLILAGFAWRQHSAPTRLSWPAMTVCFSIAQWSLTYALELGTQNPMLKLIAHHAKYVGMTAVPLSAFIFCVHYVGKGFWLKQRLLLLLIAPFVVTMVMIVTNQSHGWMWPSLAFTRVGELTVVVESQGPWAWANSIYLYALGVSSIVLIMRHMAGASALYRRQYAMLMIGLIPPFIASLIVTFGLSPISWTTFSFGVTAITIGWGLTRFSLLDILPIANRTVIEHMPDGMIVLDHKERIISVNPAALWLIGKDRNALLGLPASVLAPLGLDAAMLRQEKTELTVKIDNRLVYLEIHGSPLTSLPDDRSGRVLVLRDITERKRAESLLKQALTHEQEVNAIKSRFVSVVSHEFRTPLAVIGTTTYLLRVHMRKMSPETVMSKLEAIESQVETINDLFEDVLTLSRMQTDRVSFDPVTADIVAISHDLIAELFPIEIERVVWQTTTAVEMPLDKQLLRLILSNLVSNALKYSQPEQSIYLSIEVHDDEVHLRVRDEGIGIPEADRQHLFEPFFRAGNVGSIQGSGLGLSIVKEAVDLHGGTIALVSDDGQGSEFLLSLPLNVLAQSAAFADVS